MKPAKCGDVLAAADGSGERVVFLAHIPELDELWPVVAAVQLPHGLDVDQYKRSEWKHLDGTPVDWAAS